MFCEEKNVTNPNLSIGECEFNSAYVFDVFDSCSLLFI